MSIEGRTEHVTCLGCGCGCDDLTVQVSNGRIVEVSPVCPVGRAWFGDGAVPAEVRLAGKPATIETAIAEAASILVGAVGQCLICLGLDVNSQAQRAALALADLLRARVDTPTSTSAGEGILAAQRRGRCACTLGEIRNRADVILFWGVDPTQRYPRYTSRYAVNPSGTHVSEGRGGRTLIGVSIGDDRSIAEADVSLTLQPDEEISVLSSMRASVLGRPVAVQSPAIPQALEIAARLSRARYAVLVHDAEPTAQPRDRLRTEALIGLTQALNTPTRAALSSLRGGGNRVGAEAVLTAQSGYPFALDYSRGYPRYVPTSAPAFADQTFRALLVIGSVPNSPPPRALASATLVIAPNASASSLQPHIAIDTGVAGIHEGGTAYRMDEVPLQLRPPLQHTRSTAAVIDGISRASAERLRGTPR